MYIYQSLRVISAKQSFKWNSMIRYSNIQRFFVVQHQSLQIYSYYISLCFKICASTVYV